MQEPAKVDSRRKVSQSPSEKVSAQSSEQSSEQQHKLEGNSFTAQTTLTLETAMSLYGLTESQSFWETQQDTRCLLGWGSNTVVVAFRGTASMKNALADVQVPFYFPCLHGPVSSLLLQGSKTVAVAFTGTASMKNALADVQVPFYWPLEALDL